MTLSMPVKIVALAALALALGMAGVLLLFSHKGSSSPEVIPAAHHAPAARAVQVVTHVKAKAKPKPKVHLYGNLPAPLRRGLLRGTEVVAVVYASNVAGDRAAAAEARAGARMAHVGFVALNVLDNATATAVARWTTSTVTPAVYVVRRPGGSAAYTLPGVTDRQSVAQAALAAK